MQIGIDSFAANQTAYAGGVSTSKESVKTEDNTQLNTGVSDTVKISQAAQELLKAATTDSGGGVEPPPQNPVEPDQTQAYTGGGSEEPLTLMSGGGVEPPAPFSGGGVEPPKR